MKKLEENTACITSLVTLHKDAPEPLYAQLFQQLETLILNNELKPGTLLPTETAFSEALNVSKITIKRSYMELRNRKLITSNRKGGTTVLTPGRLDTHMFKLRGFTQEMHELGMTPSSKILEQSVIQDRGMASMFGLNSNASLLKIERIRYGNEKPLSHEIAWYNLHHLPELQTIDLSESIYQAIQQHCKHSLDWCEQTVEAVLSNPIENQAFGFTASQPCLLIKRRSYSQEGILLEYVEGTFRGDAYAYRVKMKG
ncbi:GntR family transcriptional regulator [Methylobacillus gramineus]|uniref:GntR family transcriptional regulator n=1 Tax=Methylobacillus gramineus TaxID=755169 RepID=UPI001CFFE8F3|nr:GntR family transcriptional regulator [Methylobacillus gramineus]MCB5186175.1 GntR family transcriptional regulator [Methylobacillus gramineus]